MRIGVGFGRQAPLVPGSTAIVCVISRLFTASLFTASIGTATGAFTGKTKKPGARLRAFFAAELASGPDRPPFKSAAGIFKRRDKIFFTRAFKFLLCGFEVRHAHSDFFALLCEPFLPFGHANPCDSCPASNGGRDWGANWEAALQDCD